MDRSWRSWLVAAAVATLVVAACGGDDDDSASSSTTETTAEAGGEATEATEATDATTETSETTEATTETTGTESGPQLVVDPTTGLTDGATVKVSVSGFTAGKTVGINECSDQGDATGAGDCNLAGIKTITIGADGTGTFDAFPVLQGPFGENNRVCGEPDPCVISVGELTAEPDAERSNSVEITFG